MKNTLLGKQTEYAASYAPSLLHSIPRKEQRKEIGIFDNFLPFDGIDLWNAYELSWLNPKGKPEVAIAQFIVPCRSPSIVESKSLKLYLNSFNQFRFQSKEEVEKILAKDLSKAISEKVEVQLFAPDDPSYKKFSTFSGESIDEADSPIDCYTVNPDLLACSEETVSEKLFTRLFKSNCPVTQQPDWATLMIHYEGPKIHRFSLLKYLVSYRQHSGFHEHCIERIYMDIKGKCGPKNLAVLGNYTRRGGIDINPLRSNFQSALTIERTVRQ